MRTTIDLPPDVHERAKQLAAARNQSLSATVAELTVRGLASMGEPLVVSSDPTSGLPVVSLGRRITSAEVAEILDDV